MKKLVVFLVVICLAISFADGARRRKKKPPPVPVGPDCHLAQMETCVKPLDEIARRPQASNIITRAEGVEELCRYVHSFDLIWPNSELSLYRTALNYIDCKQEYFNNCTPPLYRDTFAFFMEQPIGAIKLFCDSPSAKQSKFLTLISIFYRPFLSLTFEFLFLIGF